MHGCRQNFLQGGGKNRSAEWRAPKARGRGAASAEGGGVWAENFSIFELKKASFGAFWVLFFEVELNGLQQIQLEIPDWGFKYPFAHFQGGASAPLAYAWRRP